MSHMLYKIQNIESKIRALETIWYGWVEYFRPAKVSPLSIQYRFYKENVILYELDHIAMIEKISKNHVGSIESTNAVNALYVQGRLKLAYAELKELQHNTKELFYI